MKKRILALTLAICLICAFLPVPASATEIVASGKLAGSSISWTLDSDGLLTLSGSGEMPPCSMETGVPWYKYAGRINAAVVEEGITSIGKYCFYKCFNLKSVSLPDSVTSIGSKAFYWCNGLTEIKLPENLETISDSAFFSCDRLETITFGSKLTHIGYTAFDCCRALTEITIPASVQKLNSYCFRSCESLQTVTFLGDAPEFVGSVFSGNGLFSNMICRYPAGNPTWTSDVMQGYGGRVTWVPYEASEDAAVPGDLNGDDAVSDQDVAALLWHTLFPEAYPISGNGDINGDGAVTDADVAYLLWHTLFPDAYPLS